MGTGVVATKTGEDLFQLLEILDGKSRALLWHLWWHRHAEIALLRDVIDARSDFEVLHRLKDVVNKRARGLWGRPIVRFEQSKIDPETGEKVLFNWWFQGEMDMSITDRNQPLVDVFNDEDGVTVIMQLPTSVDAAHPDIQFKNGVLKLRFCKNKG
jgi:hypothetical protein